MFLHKLRTSASTSFDTKEHRLCSMSPDAEPPAEQEAPKSEARKQLDEMYNFPSTIPGKVKDAAKYVWEKVVPSKEDVQAFFSKAADFFNGGPSISQIIGSRIDAFASNMKDGMKHETLMQLVDHQNWIPLFTDEDLRKDFLDGQPIDENKAKSLGQKTVIQFLNHEGVSQRDRQVIFIEYLDRFIPPEIQKQYGVDTIPNKPLDKYRAMLKAKEEGKDDSIKAFSEALSKIMGIPVSGDPKQEHPEGDDIARNVLHDYYYNNKDDTLLTKNLSADYKDALRHGHMTGIGGGDVSVDRLLANQPASRFRGAMKLGVVSDLDLGQVKERFRSIDDERRTMEAEVATKLDTLSGETKNKLRAEGESFLDMWNKRLSGNEKLILIAAGAAGLVALTGWLGKWAQRAAVLAGGVGAAGVATYFGLKLFNNDKNPDMTMTSWGRGGMNWIGGMFSSVTGIGGGEMPTMAGHAEAAMNAVPNTEDKESYKNQVIGLSVLMGIPMNILALNFDITKASVADWRLTMDKSGLEERLRTNIKKSGYKMDMKNFVEQNPNDVSQALSNLFYKVAAQKPQYASETENVVKALGKLPANEQQPWNIPRFMNDARYADSKDLLDKGYKSFLFLVKVGHEECRKGRAETAGKFLQGEIMQSKKEQLDLDRNQQQYERKKAEILSILNSDRTYEQFKDQFKITIERGQVVKFGIANNQMAETTLQKFNANNAIIILERYRTWTLDNERKTKDPLN